MSAYNPAYNPTSYLTDVYGRPVPENPYTPFYPGPPTDQYVPHHWTPDPNQAFYAPSISQGIPGAALLHSLLMATTPACTLGGIPQCPPTLPTFPPPTTTCTQSPLQPQPLWGLWTIIPPLVCHSPPKPLLLPGSKGSKSMPNNATKSSASSASLPRSLQDAPTPSSPT
ncbi:hypothetical protein J132_04567 [Termitomyces sp. J132]|nr:hypothetical protein J132_04567 [Termitomyces sp. J132]